MKNIKKENDKSCKNVKEIENIVGIENVKYDEPMNKHTSFKVGGKADIFVIIESKEKLEQIIQLNSKLNLDITVIGNGTNLLVKDEGIRGLVIKYVSDKIKIDDEIKEKDKSTIETNKCIDEKNTNNNTNNETTEIIAESGILNGKLAQVLLQNSLSGFEFASGIPGTLGGAIVMNAGAFGNEMKDIIREVTYLDLEDKKIYTIDAQKCDFKYRKSIFYNKKTIILNAKLMLHKSKKSDIKSKMDEYREKRMNTQPLDKPSAGSTFKRGSDFITAKLIDEAGLKGYSIGGAEISSKHAGFIINKGNATASDIINLIEYVKKTIFEKYKKKIETEVRIIGQ